MKFLDLEVPICVCEEQADKSWKVKRDKATVKAIANKDGSASDAITVLSKYDELFKINSEVCLAKNKKLEAIVALPERYQLSPDGHIPQLICLFVEKREDGTLGKDYYPITIPHPTITTAPITPPLNVYQKGSWEGILTLKDNSKVFVNALSQAEAETIINQTKTIIDPKYTEGSFYKVGQRKGQPLKEIKVQLVRVDYYPEGTKDKKPKWLKFF
ncbi:hypothetical protein FM036_29480 [Nostoc sp. HG1]|nr:hypothetical protein [Nostoc sp. HG1]